MRWEPNPVDDWETWECDRCDMIMTGSAAQCARDWVRGVMCCCPPGGVSHHARLVFRGQRLPYNEYMGMVHAFYGWEPYKPMTEDYHDAT